MSDNPGSEEPIIEDLGIEVDEAGFDQLNERLNALQANLEALAQAEDDIAASVETTNEAIDQIGVSAQAPSEAFQQWTADMQAFRDETDKAIQSQQELADASTAAQQAALSSGNYTVGGGGIGEDAGAGGADDGSGGGSVYGLARGLSFAGRATGMRGLSSVGGAIYIEQALQQVGPLLDQLGAKMAELGTQAAIQIQSITSEIAAGTELNLVFAQVPSLLLEVAVAAPLAVAAIAGIAIAVKSFVDEINAGNKAVEQGFAQLKAYYTAIETGTAQSVQSSLEKLQIQRQIDQDQLAQEQGKLDALHQSYVVNNSVATSVTDLVDGGKTLQDQVDKLNKSVADETGQINGLNDATNAAATAERTRREEIQKTIDVMEADRLSQVSEQVSFAEQQAQLVKGANAKAVEDTIESKQIQLDAQKKAIQDLKDQLNEVSHTPAQFDAINAAIQQYEDSNTVLEMQIQSLTATTLPLAAAAQELATAEKAQADATKQYQSALKDIATEQQAEADATTKYTDAKATALQNQIANEAQIQADNSAKRTQEMADFNQTQADNVQAFHDRQAEETTTFHQKQADEVVTFNQSISDIQTKAHDQRQKDEVAYQAASRQAEIDLANKLAQIRADLGASELSDASHLDARKLESDKEAAAKKNTDAQTTFDNEKAKRDDAENQKLNDLNTQTDQEIAQRTTAFQQKQAQEQVQEGQKQAQEQRNFEEGRRKAETQFQQKLAKEDQQEAVAAQKRQDQYAKQSAALDKNYQDQISSLRTNLEHKLGIQDQSQIDQLASAQNFADQLKSIITTGYTQALANISDAASIVNAHPQFPTGEGGGTASETIGPGPSPYLNGPTGSTLPFGPVKSDPALTYGAVGGAGSDYRSVHGPFAGGLENVPYSGFLAQLDEGERVLPADANASLARIVSMLSSGSTTNNNNRGGDTYYINSTELSKSAFKTKLQQILEEI